QDIESNIWIGNLECVISNTSIREGLHKKQFLIEPKYLKEIKHLSLYNIANNHIMQHGDVGYKNTIEFLLSNSIDYMGCLNKKSHIIEYKNKMIGFLSLSQRDEKYSEKPLYWYNPEYAEILRELQ